MKSVICDWNRYNWNDIQAWAEYTINKCEANHEV